METVLRVSIVYFFLVFSLRVMGKREFSQLSPLELVTLLLIPELVAQAIVREDFSMVNALVAASTLFSWVFVSSLLQYHSKRVATLISGSPAVIVADGQLIQDNLNRERVTPEEILGVMRQAGLEQLSQVKWAILETDGRISIIPTEGQNNVRRSDTDVNKAI